MFPAETKASSGISRLTFDHRNPKPIQPPSTALFIWSYFSALDVISVYFNLVLISLFTCWHWISKECKKA